MLYVLSDIHGNQQRFDSVMAQIDLQPEDTLYVLGDVIDRHPQGIRILRQIMAMENARMLLGNHEYMLLRALGHPYDSNADDGNALTHWYRNGGQVTHDQLKALPPQAQKEIFDYLLGLPLNIALTLKGTRYLLVHGAPTEWFSPDPPYLTPAHYSVWKRIELQDPSPRDYTLIFGHTPTVFYQPQVPMCPWYSQGRIGIDCGSGFPEDTQKGRLACLRLDDGKVFYSTGAPAEFLPTKGKALDSKP